MRGRWTFSRKLALGFVVNVVAFAIVAVTGLRTTQSPAAGTATVDQGNQATAQIRRRCDQTLQTSSQKTSLSTSLTRRVQATWRSTMEISRVLPSRLAGPPRRIALATAPSTLCPRRSYA